MSLSFRTPKTTNQNSMITMTTPANTSCSTQASADFFLGSNSQPGSTGCSLGGTNQQSTGFSLGTNSASTGFSLGTTSTSVFSLKSSGTTTSQATTLQTTAAITTQSPPVISQSDSKFSAVQPTNFQKLVVLIKKLIVSLENQEKQFLSKAIELTVGDHVLTNQSTKLVRLNDILEQKKKEQAAFENELDFLFSKQKELEDYLVLLKQELQSAEVLSSLKNERESMYKAVQEIDNEVKQMLGDIKEMVRRLNKVYLKKNVDDLDTICRILNCYMTALQHIENDTEN